MNRLLLPGPWARAGGERILGRAVGRRAADRLGEPFADGEMFAEIVCGGCGFEELCEEFGAFGQGGAEAS